MSQPAKTSTDVAYQPVYEEGRVLVPATGFGATPTAILLAVQDNLVAGMGQVVASLNDGTFIQCGPKGAAPPAESGQLTLALLDGIRRELAGRLHPKEPTR